MLRTHDEDLQGLKKNNKSTLQMTINIQFNIQYLPRSFVINQRKFPFKMILFQPPSPSFPSPLLLKSSERFPLTLINSRSGCNSLGYSSFVFHMHPKEISQCFSAEIPCILNFSLRLGSGMEQCLFSVHRSIQTRSFV